MTKAVQALKTVKILDMKAGESTPNEDQLKLINRFTRRELKAEDVYIYPILLCDNEVDRDEEYFEKADLELLAGLAPGTTGIFDHRWASDGQVARLFMATVESTGTMNSRGVEYWYLKGWAYILRLEKYKDLIAEIDGGIKKEVSIGFSYTTPICSICGGDYRNYEECQHVKGRVYNKDICRVRMANPRELYEYSHVAVPAQPAAGAIKGLGLSEEMLLSSQTAEKEVRFKESHISTKNKFERNDDEMNLLEVMKSLGVEAKDNDHAITTIKDWQSKASKAAELEQELDSKKTLVSYGEQYIADLKAECLRLGGIVDKSFNAEVMKSIFDKCSVDELKAFKKQYEEKMDEVLPPVPQSKSGDEKETQIKSDDNDAYRI